MRVIIELVRLIILILLLPLALIIIGPLLVLAVLRGEQQMGPITFNAAQYDFAGQVGIVTVGLVAWLLVWGGLAWLTIAALSSPPPALAQIPFIFNSAVSSVVAIEPAPTVTLPTRQPVTTDQADTVTITAVPATNTASPTVTPTFTPTPVLPTATALDEPANTPTLRPTRLALTPTPIAIATSPISESLTIETPTSKTQATPTRLTNPATATPTATVELPTPVSSPTPQATLTFNDRLVAVAAVREANTLLRETIALANEENLESLGTVWEGKALTIIEKFAAELFDRYARPFTVAFEYITPPAVTNHNYADQVLITSQEKWSYGGPTKTHQEAFEFIYTLKRREDRWVITSYTYRNISLPPATAQN